MAFCVITIGILLRHKFLFIFMKDLKNIKNDSAYEKG